MFLVSDSSQIVAFDIDNPDCKADVFVKEQSALGIFVKDEFLYVITESGFIVKHDIKTRTEKEKITFKPKTKGDWSTAILPRKSNFLVCINDLYQKLEQTNLVFRLFTYSTLEASKPVKSGLRLI